MIFNKCTISSSSHSHEFWRIDVNQDDLRFGRTGQTDVLIDGSGNVGIGTTSPAGDLHVVGATGSAGRIYVADADNGTTATDSLLLTKSGDTAFVYNRESSGDLQLGAGDTPGHVVIKSSGNVGIGTTSPDVLLHVNHEDLVL